MFRAKSVFDPRSKRPRDFSDTWPTSADPVDHRLRVLQRKHFGQPYRLGAATSRRRRWRDDHDIRAVAHEQTLRDDHSPGGREAVSQRLKLSIVCDTRVFALTTAATVPAHRHGRNRDGITHAAANSVATDFVLRVSRMLNTEAITNHIVAHWNNTDVRKSQMVSGDALRVTDSDGS